MCVDGGLGWPGLLQIRVGCGGNRFLFCGIYIYIYMCVCVCVVQRVQFQVPIVYVGP